MPSHPADAPPLQLSEPSLRPWKPASERNVVVLMSGGVDSSTAAALLSEAGWNVVGLTMVLPIESDAPNLAAARAVDVCRRLDLPHYVVDVRAAFESLVLDPFRRDYAEGRTPNPCVTCNVRIKFGRVFDLAREALGVTHLATGHYARTESGRLLRAADRAKDQSYFLYRIPRDRLAAVLFPLGAQSKTDTRRMARERGLPVAETGESMDICFAAEGDYRRLLPESARAAPGPIVDPEGNVLGRHTGIAHYTVGQRRGLGIAAARPLYVLGICPRTNTIVAGPREAADCRDVAASDLNLLEAGRVAPGARLAGKLRSAGEPAPLTVTEAAEDALRVTFDEPCFAPTPGQSLVLYDGDEVVGGGIIRAGESALAPGACACCGDAP
jgi:tRNA-specific 2-thiouridylase